MPLLESKSMAPGMWPARHDSDPLASIKTTDLAAMAAFSSAIEISGKPSAWSAAAVKQNRSRTISFFINGGTLDKEERMHAAGGPVK